jgi:CRP-like cAMP-binding protein
VFHLDDPVRVVHFVRRGAIHLVRREENGASLILQRARAGSILAEASVYSDRHHCDAVAESEAAIKVDARTGEVPR